MNILLINHYAGSPEMGMEFRPYYFAKKWNEKGHNTVILAADNSHIRRKNPGITGDFQEQIIDGVKYVWVKTPAYEGNGFKRLLNMFSFVRKLFFNAGKIVEKYKPDVVIASSTYPLDNYVARKIKRLSGAKYVYEVHDLWPLSPMELGGMSKHHPFILVMQAAENCAYKHCDAVVSMLPKTKDYIVSHGLSPEKWFYVPNGICLEEIKNTEPLPEHHKEILNGLKRQGKTIVGYAGTLGLANALHSFVEAAKKCKNEKLHFIITGVGPEKENLKRLAGSSTNITFLDAVKKTQVQSLLSYHDILFISLKRNSLFRFGISPNKIFDYMYAAKPVIMAIEAGNNIVEEAGCGIAIEPENPQAIIDGLTRLLKLPEEELKKMGENGRNFVLKNHTVEVLADKFLEIIK